MKNENYYKAGYAEGVKIACAINNISTGEIIRKSAKVDTLLSDPSFQNMLCKAAAMSFELGGLAGTLEHRLFVKMAGYNAAKFSDYTAEKFLVPVVKAFAKKANELKDECMRKQAAQAGIGSLIGRLFGKTVSSGPELARLMTMLSLGGGAAAGSIAWAMNRDANQSEADVESKELQAEHYRDIAQDIQKRMNLESEAKDPEKKKILRAAEEAGDSEYVV